MTGDSVRKHVRLLAIVGPPVVSPDSALDACLAAEAGGATAVQVRWKAASASQLLALTENLVGRLSVPVYVNDRADVAWASKAAGVHLGADDLDPNRVRSASPGGFLIGASVGNIEEAARTIECRVDYWSIGAIYNTSTKHDAGTPIGIDGFKQLAALAPEDMPVIAIGGIDRSNVADILMAGAVGVAVVNGIFGASDIERNARALRSIIDDVMASKSH